MHAQTNPIAEFPHIRIDQFRTFPGRPPPLACFLSHIHSDHLLGLDSLKSPFVYCSPATREVLLRLEKFPHRMNFAKGIAEVTKQTYRHLKKLLKPIPLDTPTRIELSPGHHIQVTLLDSNHCLGAVMFLIESPKDAILYTGDIRSEPWWVNNLARHPKLVSYIQRPQSHGVRRLSKVYLDTTFATKADPYCIFPPKSDGMAELLRALTVYPADTKFYMHAWTFGYEDVWLALSQALDSPIHLDRYRYDAYTSIRRSQGPGLEAKEAPALCGFMVGNVHHRGILTTDPNVRLHSCEKGSGCPMLEGPEATRVVHIKPIISRHGNVEIAEMGLGGGKGDLDQVHTLDLGDANAVAQLKALCKKTIDDPSIQQKVNQMLDQRVQDGETRFAIDLASEGCLTDLELEDDLPLGQVIKVLVSLVEQSKNLGPSTKMYNSAKIDQSKLITFPYSRHSSYNELRHLVSTFRPKDIFPCTAPTPAEYDDEKSMQALFGDVCQMDGDGDADTRFSWDVAMRAAVAEMDADGNSNIARQRKRSYGQLDGPVDADGVHEETQREDMEESLPKEGPASSQLPFHSAPEGRSLQSSQHNKVQQLAKSNENDETVQAKEKRYSGTDSAESGLGPDVAQRLRRRQEAYEAAMSGTWAQRIKLQCTNQRKTSQEM